eukprot:CAMPEP_0174949892 /NCGR_PEP_ID=MMETSP1355-20121228/92715_1 /TAXON_ID=464990 /ORGANISM="Hemiselmis tepida, Strain CCMP443" /LENGTH=122 /DNA_ID=CAMNT_0016197471 /DNA_START=60 /DNA_END=424 /DNA_ORIENTATION=+
MRMASPARLDAKIRRAMREPKIFDPWRAIAFRLIFLSVIRDSACLRSGVGSHFHADNLVRVPRWFSLGQLVDYVHTLADLTPDRILAVQEAGIVKADEELAVCRVRGRCAGHGTCAADMGFG